MQARGLPRPVRPTPSREPIASGRLLAAAAGHAFPGDQAALGDAAHARGLYRTAAQLHKNAAAGGNSRAVSYLMKPPRYLHGDLRPVRWAAAHAPLGDLLELSLWLDSLRRAGAHDEAATLAGRAAAHASLRESGGGELLRELREAGAQDQVAALADRAVAQVSLGDPDDVFWLLYTLREAGAQDQVAALLRRDPAAHVSVGNPHSVAGLLAGLREAGAQDQVAALADRAADHISFGDPRAVTLWLHTLQTMMGAQDQAAVLLRRDPAAHVSLRDPGAVARLLDELREAGALLDEPQETGAQDQAAALLRRDPAARVSLGDPGAVARLLDSLRAAGAQDQAAALADRAAAHAPLGNPDGVALLLAGLRQAGAQDQVAVLLRRDPAARVSLGDPGAVARLLDSLRAAGAQDQVAALADRLPGAGMFQLYCGQAGRQDRYPFGREADGSPAEPWGWEDLD